MGKDYRLLNYREVIPDGAEQFWASLPVWGPCQCDAGKKQGTFDQYPRRIKVPVRKCPE